MVMFKRWQLYYNFLHLRDAASCSNMPQCVYATQVEHKGAQHWVATSRFRGQYPYFWSDAEEECSSPPPSPLVEDTPPDAPSLNMEPSNLVLTHKRGRSFKIPIHPYMRRNGMFFAVVLRDNKPIMLVNSNQAKRVATAGETTERCFFLPKPDGSKFIPAIDSPGCFSFCYDNE